MKGVMIQKVKTAKMFFSYEVLTNSSLVTVKITVVILVVYQKMKNNNAIFIQIKTKTMQHCV